MPFNPKFIITPKINKALVEIERVRGFLDNEYQSAVSCIRRTAQRDLENLAAKKIIKMAAKNPTDPTKHYVLL